MDAIELLEGDHEKLRTLLGRLAETTPAAVKTRSELLERIRRMLGIHTSIEEEIFYPAFREASEQSVEKADEDETDMFTRARKLLGKQRLTELGERMQRRKHELGG